LRAVTKVRRTPYALLYCADSGLLDLGRLIRGTVEIARSTQLVAVSVLTGDERPLEPEDLELLLRVPADRWVPVDELVGEAEASRRRVEDLAHAGLLVTDAPAGPLADLRRREERLDAVQWHPHAALFHLAVRRHAADADPSPEAALPSGGGEAIVAEALERLAAEGRAPPSHFRSRTDTRRVDLPLPPAAGALYDVLSRRRTTRAFDPTAALGADELATLLHQTFGVRGLAQVSPHLTLVHKTSPSGGALHPVEAYPLIVRGSGLATGLYHYDAGRHALEELAALPETDARALAEAFTGGEPDWRGASALVVLTARFSRSFWKYSRDPRAYAVLLLDAGHLSQTFQLVCAELGLGAFVTAAIGVAEIEERLGLDPAEEGAIAICGCGVPAGPEPRLRFEPYSPPRPGE
jgi:putative peptide maturation dehydrogenase